MGRKRLIGLVLLGTLPLIACRREPSHPAVRTAFLETVATPVRISMADLHQSGGVPPGWVFALPTGDPVGGRVVFDEHGCPTCHIVAGETFASDGPDGPNRGPELTGMGSHHPEGYFAEAILNPDAVLIEGEGYAGEDGRSNMPAYPDMTAEQLTDVVAYLKSLVDPGMHEHPGAANTFTGRVDTAGGNLPPPERTTAPPSEGERPPSLFFVQTYSVREGKLGALERWFQGDALPVFRSFAGLVDVETYVDRTRGPESLVTIFSFADMETLRRFLAERRVAQALQGFDDFAEVIDRQTYESKPVYRVGAMSAG